MNPDFRNSEVNSTIESASNPETAPPPVMGQTMLVVDDNDVLRERLSAAFERRGYEVRNARDYHSAIALAKQDSPELAVIDLRMPGKSGLELLRDLMEIDPATKVVMLTGFGSIANAVEAMRLGASNYVTKPADADDVLAAFVRAEDPEGNVSVEYETPTLARAEWEHINRVLTESCGNISEAARRLGIHRRSLQRKLQKLAPE